MCNMNFVSNERIYVNLPIFDVMNYEKWWGIMKVFFGYQDVLEVIKNGVSPLVKGATDARQTTHKKEKKDFKTLFFIHKCVDGNNFDKVGNYESSKQTLEILEKAYAEADKVKVVRLKYYKC